MEKAAAFLPPGSLHDNPQLRFCSAGPAHSSGYGELSHLFRLPQELCLFFGAGSEGEQIRFHLVTSYFCQ